MNIIQKQSKISYSFSQRNNIEDLSKKFFNEPIIRFSIINNQESNLSLDYATIEKSSQLFPLTNIFEKNYRTSVNNDNFNAVLIIPTGIGSEVGGDSGDGNVAARLISGVVDNLITHPNVVNASDINEMKDNTLYVEGSILNRFILGTIGLQKVRSNKMLLIIDPGTPFFINSAINTASAARVTLGADIDVLQLTDVPEYNAFFNENGIACGKVTNIEKLLSIINKYKWEYDSFCLQTLMSGMEKNVMEEYFKNNIEVNPWGGIEAMITHTVSNILGVPVAHAPMTGEEKTVIYDFGIVNPEKSPETLSKTELFCVIKGMYKSPRIVSTEYIPGVLTNRDIHALITPDRCIGLPILAALDQNIPVIAIDDNKNIMKNDLDLLPWRKGQFFRAKNYLEATGILVALKNGVRPESLKRPLNSTKIIS
jgi:hypothetical protein